MYWARVGKGLAEFGIGLGQIIVGGSAAVGGGGASATGGGAIVGVPVCVAGVALATNGAVTFINGSKTLILAVCHWEDLPSAGDTAPSSAPQSTGPAPAAGQTTPPVAKPAAKQATSTPPTNKTNTSPPPRRRGGTKVGKNTTTWVKCTGQWHHAISKKIHRELEKHPNLKGIYKYRDERFVTQAVDEAAHKGYQKWHMKLDKEIADWIKINDRATPKDFEAELLRRYGLPELKAIFPNGF